MTANEPPNPYAAPSTALAGGTAGAVPAPPEAPKPPRKAAVVAALFGFPPGAGFYILGRRRLFIGWMVAGVVASALMIGCIRAPLPKLCVIAIAAAIAVRVATILATMIAKPGATPLSHAGRWVLLSIVMGIGASVAVKQWLVEAFKVPSGSMIPTLEIGDHIFVKKGQAVTRGDVVVFDFPQDTRTQYIKRVVAIGGDTVEVRDGVVSINGVALAQTPIDGACPAADRAGEGRFGEPIACKMVRETNAGRSYTIMFEEGRAAMDHPRTIIPPGHFFVLGDNRDNSYDSRKWGAVAAGLIEGKATVTWWSSGAGGVRWSRVGQGVE